MRIWVRNRDWGARWSAVVCVAIFLAGCPSARKQPDSDSLPPSRIVQYKEFLREQIAGPESFTPKPRDLANYFMPDIMGNGVCLADFDGDQDLDIFLCGSDENRLLFNEAGKFVDKTVGSGLEKSGYATGAAVGDFDNDGDLDLYVTAFESDYVFLNQGSGRFEDVTSTCGVNNPLWSTAAAARDFDGDGRLDLFVVNYLDYQASNRCDDGSGRPDFCGPTTLPGLVDKLYLNRSEKGRLRFEDATVASGLAALPGRGLGLLCRDFDQDGRLDCYVANDMEPNRLWLQVESGRFENVAALWGVAVNGIGQDEASMGVAFGDWNGDGGADLLLTHIRGESNTAYVWEDGAFSDRSARLNIAASSVPYTGFGVSAADLDHDGWQDLAIANGRVKRAVSRVPGGPSDFWKDYAEANQLFIADGRGRFAEKNELGGAFTSGQETSRAVACGDLDGDGDLDLVVSHEDAPVKIYWNDFPKRGSWLMVRTQTEKRSDQLGCRVEVVAADRVLWRETRRTSSYLAQHDPRAHFGLGEADSIRGLRVRWPDGVWEDFPPPPVDQHCVVVRGQGTPHDAENWRRLTAPMASTNETSGGEQP